MKKYRLTPILLSLLLLFSACAPRTQDPPAPSASTPAASVPEPAEKEPEHPFTADTSLAGALADYPGLLRLDGTLYGESQNYIISRDGFYGSDETLAPLRDSLSTAPARYYTASRQLEDRTYETAVFDAEGRQVSDYDASEAIFLFGGILVRANYQLNRPDPYRTFADSAVFQDLETGEILWELGRCLVLPLDDAHFTVTVQPAETAVPELSIVRADDLSVVKRFENESGLNAAGTGAPEGCVVLSDGFYSLPLDRTFDRLEQFCGEGALLRNENGGYDLIRLSDGAVLEEGTSRRYDFWSEAVSSWTNGPDGPKYCYAPEAYGEEPQLCSSVGSGMHMIGGKLQKSYFSVRYEDQSVDVLDYSGKLLYSIRSEDYPDMAIEFWPGWETYGWTYVDTMDGIEYFGPNGEKFHFDLRSSYTMSSVALKEGCYRFRAVGTNGQVLLDETGKVLASGLDNLYPVTIPGDDFPICFQASAHGRTGLMDLDGSWLWQEEGNPLTDYFEATSDAPIWLNDSLTQRTLVMVQDGVIEYDPADELDAAYLDVYPLADALTGDPARLYVESRRSNLTEDAPIETGVFNSSGGFADQYDSSSVLLLAGDILVRGNYEIQNSDGYIFATDVTFERLGTMGYGELLWEPGRCYVRAAGASHLMVCLQPDEDSAPETLLVDAATLEVVKRFPGVYGVSDNWQYTPVPDGWVLLFDENWENPAAYSFALDRTFDRFVRFCGEGMLAQDEQPGRIDIIRLSDGEVVYRDTHPRISYWSDSLAYWIGENGYQPYLYAEELYGDEPFEVNYAVFDSSGYTYISLEDGTLELLDRDFNRLFSVPTERDNTPQSIGGGWIRLRTDTGMSFFSPDGSRYFLDGFNVWPAHYGEDPPLFVRQEEDGAQTLLDGDGRAIASGLQNIYQPAPEGKFLCASEDGRLGLLSFDGSWLWREDG